MNETSGYGNDLPIDYHRIVKDHDYYELMSGLGTDGSNKVGTFKGILALVSRIGFILIQVGSIPVENVYRIIVYNLIEICLVILSYGFLGNYFAFGHDTKGGLIGYGGWQPNFSFMFSNLDGATIGFCGTLLATAQMSSLLVGRISSFGAVLLIIIYAGIFQPIIMHWTWHYRGWMSDMHIMETDTAVKDHAGGLTLHIPSAIFGTIGALFLGRRIMELKDLDQLSFGTGSILSVVTGYLLIILNYIVFALPTPLYETTHALDDNTSDNFAVVLTNSLIAIGGGIFTVTILQLMCFRDIYRHRRMIRCVQGGVAGLITLSAAIDLYFPSVAFLTVMGSTLFFFFFVELIDNSALEDPCGIISSHLICGFIGVMLCPLLAQEDSQDGVTIKTRGIHLLWQFTCTIVIISVSTVTALFIFLLLKILRILRNKYEVVNHRKASTLRDLIPKRRLLGRLFATNSTTDHVVPGYRKKYFGIFNHEASSQNPRGTNSFHPDGDSSKKIALASGTSQNDSDASRKVYVNVMHFNMEPTPRKQKVAGNMCGSGDYFDSYQEIKTVCCPKNTSLCYKTSYMGFNEV